MKSYEVFTMGALGDLEMPLVGPTAPLIHNVPFTWDGLKWLITGSPVKEVAKYNAQRGYESAKKVVREIEAQAGRTLDRFDPRVIAMRELGPSGDELVTLGKVVAVGTLVVLGIVAFKMVKTARKS